MNSHRFPEDASIAPAGYYSLIVPSVQGLLPQLDCELLLASQPSLTPPNLVPGTRGPVLEFTQQALPRGMGYVSLLPALAAG